MKWHFWKAAIIGIGLTLCVASGAQAYIMFLGEGAAAATAQAEFMDAARTNFLVHGTENFENNFYSDDPYDDNSGLTFENSALTAYVPQIGGTTSPVQLVTQYSTQSLNRYPTSGHTYLDAQSSMSVIFTAPISALGFYLTDLGDFSESLALKLQSTSGESTVINIPNRTMGDGSLLYFGLYDMNNLYSRIDFEKSGDRPWDDFGLDDMTVAATPVPLPATFWMLGTSLLGLAGLLQISRRPR